VFTNKENMAECQTKYCTVLRGQGYSTFAIPDPKKDYNRCARWMHNLGNLKLDIRTFKYSKEKIVCENSTLKEVVLKKIFK
jgi:hypothetical protein